MIGKIELNPEKNHILPFYIWKNLIYCDVFCTVLRYYVM